MEPGRATIFKFLEEHYPPPEEAPQVVPRKKRKLDETPPQQQQPWQQQQQTAWQQQQQWQQQQRRQQQQWQQQQQQNQQEVIVLDDDGDDWAKPIAEAQRRVARKSTGGSNPAVSSKTNGVISPTERNLRRAFFACQQELREQKRLMAETQIEHQDAIRRLQEELKYAQKAAKNSTQNGHSQNGSTQETEALREAHDELTIVKRQKKQLEKELRDAREKRGSEVSGLNLEIESLKLKTEEQARTIRKLKGENGSPSADAKSPSSPNGSSWMSRMVKVKCEFQDSDEI